MVSPGSPAPESQDVLLDRYRRTGDPALLGALFDAAAPKLFRLALSILQDANLAEDALQDTFLDGFRNIRRHKPGYPVMPWLAGILQRNARKVARTARRAPDRERYQAMRRPRAAPSEPDGEDAARLRGALGTLDEPYRSAAILHFYYGLSPAEIAHVRGQPPGTVRSLLSRARERLRRSVPALALGPPPGGLQAVRETVLGHVGTGQALASSASLAGALVVVKNVPTLVVLVFLFLLLGGGGLAFMASRSGTSAPTADPGSAPVTIGNVEAEREPRLGGAAQGAPDRRPSPALPTALAITGLVVDESDQPVTGAGVFAVPHTVQDALPAASVAPASEAVVSVETKADGRFRIPVDTEDTAHTLVTRTAAGQFAVEGDVRAGDDVRITLSAPARLHGHVLDLHGAPVSGARVHLVVTADALTFEYEARSAADGAYDLPLLPARSTISLGSSPWYCCLEVVHPAFAPLFLDSRRRVEPEAHFAIPSLRPGRAATLDLVLIRGATLEGRVLEEDTDRPVGGVRVVVWSGEGRTELKRTDGTPVRTSFYGRVLAETTTGPDGSFEIAHVPANGFHALSSRGGGSLGPIFGHLTAIKEGFAPGHHEVPVLDDRTAMEATIRLWPGATIEGRVLHADGRPAAGAQMWAWTEGRHDQYSLPPALEHLATSLSHTLEDGTYRLAGIRASRRRTVEIELTAKLVLALRGRPGIEVAKRAKSMIRVRAGETKSLPDLVLDEPQVPRLRFRILDAQGAPIGNARILSWEPSQTCPTDGSGGAELLWPKRWSYVTENALPIRVSAPGYGTTTVLATPSIEPQAPIRVVLPNGRRIEGDVVDRLGRPVPGASVEIYALTGDAADAARGQKGRWRGICDRLAFTSTDAEGRFVAEDLPAGPCRVVARSHPILRDPARAEAQDVETGATDLRLTLPIDVAEALRLAPTETDAPEGGAIDVRVVEEGGGGPVALATVTLQAGARSLRGRRIRPGLVRLESVRDGIYELAVEAPGYLPRVVQDVRVEQGRLATPLEVVLSRGVTLRGRVTKRGASAVNHTLVFIAESSTASPRRAKTPIRADGAYEVSGLAPGRYWAVSPSLAPWNPAHPALTTHDNEAVEIPGGVESIQIDLILVPGGVLSVLTDEVKPQEGEQTRLELFDGSGARLADVTMHDRGDPGWLGYAVLLPGTYTLRLHRADGQARQKTVTLEAGKQTYVRSFEQE